MIAALPNHLWQSTVFALAVAVAAFLLRRNRAHVRYALWCAASAKFLVPFSLLVSLGAFVPLRTSQPAAAPTAPPVFSIAVNQITQPFHVVSSPLVQAAPSQFSWAPVAFAIWFIVFATIVAIRLKAWHRIRRAVQQSVPMPLDVGAAIDVRRSSATLEPGVVGLWHPILLLPDRITETLTPRQFETVVAHELCHVRRRDNLIAAIHMVVEAVCWFHPLVWWIGARMLAERERACDEAVLEQGLEPRDYADAILNVCKLCVESPIACVSGVSGSDLRARLEDIIFARVGRNLTAVPKVLLGLTTLAAIALPILVGAVTAPVRAQTPSGSSAAAGDVPRFDVVSIRPCQLVNGKDGGPGDSASPGYLRIECRPLLQLVQMAYIVNADGRLNPLAGQQTWTIEGAPDWVKQQPYTIEAKSNGMPTVGMMRGPMLQALLEDRFKLKIHPETREGPIYELIVAKGGSKLSPFKEGSCVNWGTAAERDAAKAGSANTPAGLVQPGQRLCRAGWTAQSTQIVWDVQGMNLDDFAAMLRTDGRPVINKTGLSGLFDFHFEYDQAGSPDAPTPSIFTALKEQLGLELHAAKGPREFLVIDHVEQLTDRVDEPMRWEAASIRPCDPHDSAVVPGPRGGGAGTSVSPGRMNVPCATLENLITIAYFNYGDPKPVNVVTSRGAIHGGPSWIRTDRYTVEAEAQGTPPLSTMRGAMLRSLLEDRFQLKLHQGTTQASAFALRVADQGLKLRPVDPSGVCVMFVLDPTHFVPRVARKTPAGWAFFAADAPDDAKPFCGGDLRGVGPATIGPSVTYDATAARLDELAETLSLLLGRPVVNETHVDARYSFHLEFARDENVTGAVGPPGSAPAGGDPSGPTVFTALKQLGLVLAPTKVEQGFVVIDHVERPGAGR